MELFLLYLWLKLDVIGLWVWIITLSLFVLWALSFATTSKEEKTHSYEQWLNETEDGKSRRDSKWYDEASRRRSYEINCRTKTLQKPVFKPFKGFVLLPFFFLITSIALPTQTQTAVLVGASIALDVAKSPEGQKIGTLIRAKANELLDNELNKLNKPATK